MRNKKIRGNSRGNRTAKASRSKKPASLNQINKRRIQVASGGK